MKSKLLRIATAVVIVGIGSLIPAVGGEVRSAPAHSKHIQHLSFDLSQNDAPAFLDMTTAPELESSLLKLSSHEIPALQTPPAGEQRHSTANVTEVATEAATGAVTLAVTPAVTQERVQQVREAARGQMKEAFIKEGHEATSNRDQLTAEFFSVMRWTVVVLVIGGCVAVGLKKMPHMQRPQVTGGKMSLVETLPLGRHQMLNLVQAGGERFLVATDAAGIKSVTLLPAWETDVEVEDETPVLKANPDLAARTPFEKLVARSKSA
ncbi:flagellar biosynthetic protein FliO [Planctomicrobium sp. SH527]|uniref:flagellar biosynthetic protein FliO n=1 Tax=Planctomicrobium sp. SH527 TaxID=3448123 RepID=UPI003F5C7385